jgi:predicted nucleotidyltransferase
MNQKEEIQNKLKSLFKQEKEVLFAYLFGSAAIGKGFNFKSDVDLAVYLDEKKVKDTFQKRLRLMSETEKVLKRETEVVILNDINSVFFKFVIIKEGKLIFERNHEKRVDFELKTIQDYFDFELFIEKYNKAYLERELSKK